jgi:hypothetical protein
MEIHDVRGRLARLSDSSPLHDRLSTGMLLDSLLAAIDPSDSELAWEDVSFRRRLLDASGFAPADALALAMTPGIALKEALDLVWQGCAPETATKILL